MALTIPPDLTDFVAKKLATGEFTSLDELAFAAIRRIRNREAQELEELRSMLREADAQIDRGEYIEINSKEELKAFFEEIKRAGRAGLSREHRSTGSD